MSTALTTISGDTFLANQDEEMLEAMQAMQEAGECIGPDDLLRVKIPSGDSPAKWVVGENLEDELQGVFVYMAKRGTLWPTEEPVEGSTPVLVTNDLLTAKQIGQIPDEMIDVLEPCRISATEFDWTKLPYNEFGSARNGVGKRCEESRRIFMLRAGDMFPIEVKVPPGSLKVVMNWFKSIVRDHKVPYHRCVISLKLQRDTSATGQKFYKIEPRVVGILSREDAAIVKERWQKPLAQVSEKLDD